ncbi:MAG: glycosyltransferase [Proteobacteria bacterium]|uniref:glycosyltransferase family 2 protein n=1 Tax=Rudaea sp. TaxID=2136325 RepID=UPI001D2D1CBB|nr:glycosyltransferase [Pseudomonadota bacterium]MBS0567112.1 glycosyltransferase [Pseudomonadota bacterium]
MEAAQWRAEWLGWNGNALRWRIAGDLAGLPPTELTLDDVVFARFAADAAGAREFELAFPWSPSGHDELRFGLAVTATEPPLELLPCWEVRLGAAAAPPTASAPAATSRRLATLAGTPRLPAVPLVELPRVSIVVPIFNSPQSVQNCIAPVLRHSPNARLILIDDASTDARIAPILDAAAKHKHVLVQRNERNRGYTGSVNVGMRLAGGDDVVLLNSDTVVGPRWLAALKIAAYSADDIGTVTAVSDNAGAFSVPELERHCPIPARWTLAQAQRAVLQQAGMRYPQLPTGNGFCMYVKRVLLARIGPMDEAAFPQGYGEENDFCQRGERAGYRNLIAGNVLVHHERSASFGDERRAALGAQGMAVLRERYPDYESEVGATLWSFERRALDWRVRRIYSDGDATYAKQPPKPRLLLAADPQDVGTARLLATLSRNQECFLLRNDGDRVGLYRLDGASFQSEDSVELGRDAAALARVETRLRKWLVGYAIESVHARGSAASDRWLATLAAELDVPTL